jgi:hypothetical protein
MGSWFPTAEMPAIYTFSQSLTPFFYLFVRNPGLADELSLPFDEISLEMIYRGLYHFTMAHQKGKATDPVKYFADPQNRDLGIIKQKQKPNVKLIVAPFPDLQRGTDQFFFHIYFSKSLLTKDFQP